MKSSSENAGKTRSNEMQLNKLPEDRQIIYNRENKKGKRGNKGAVKQCNFLDFEACFQDKIVITSCLNFDIFL